MDEKEIEKIIIEAGDKIKMRDFEDTWQDLEVKMSQIKAKKKKRKKILFSTLASCAACVVIFCSVGLPLMLGGGGQDSLPTIPPSDTAAGTVDGGAQDGGQGEGEDGAGQEEIIYYYDDLIFERLNDNKQFFYEQVDGSDVGVVNLKRYDVSSDFCLYKTNGDIVKGGALKFDCAVGDLSYRVTMKFASSDVKNENENNAYGQNYENNGAVAQYKLTSSEEYIPGVIFNNFIVNASFNSVNYTMEILTNATDLTEFFNDFFVI